MLCREMMADSTEKKSRRTDGDKSQQANISTNFPKPNYNRGASYHRQSERAEWWICRRLY